MHDSTENVREPENKTQSGYCTNRKNCTELVAGSAIRQLVSAICGAGLGKAPQLPPPKSVQVCRVKPALTSGQEIVRFCPDAKKATVGLFVVNTWLDPKAYVAAISTGESAAL